VTWIFGGVALLLFAVAGLVTCSINAADDRATADSIAAARGSIERAAREFPTVASGGTLTDDQIREEVLYSQGSLHTITRHDDAIVVVANVFGQANGLLGTISSHVCVQYTIHLPAQPGSKVDTKELPPCPG
jgi:hypothetical protein